LRANGSDPNLNLNLQSKGTGSIQFTANGSLALNVFASSATDVNHLAIESNVTGASPTIKGEGSDANISISLIPKGTGDILLSAPLKLPVLTFAALSALPFSCDSSHEGFEVGISDATVATFGAAITAGGGVN